jgi:hypothetical protein
VRACAGRIRRAPFRAKALPRQRMHPRARVGAGQNAQTKLHSRSPCALARTPIARTCLLLLHLVALWDASRLDRVLSPWLVCLRDNRGRRHRIQRIQWHQLGSAPAPGSSPMIRSRRISAHPCRSPSRLIGTSADFNADTGSGSPSPPRPDHKQRLPVAAVLGIYTALARLSSCPGFTS